MLDPARYQYREMFVLLDAHWGEMAIAYCPYIFVDNDAVRSCAASLQGFPKKLGSVFQTRSFAAPSPAAAPVAAWPRKPSATSLFGPW